jgi:hypothetical protein
MPKASFANSIFTLALPDHIPPHPALESPVWQAATAASRTYLPANHLEARAGDEESALSCLRPWVELAAPLRSDTMR